MKAKSLKSLVFSILALGTIGVGLTTQANAAEWTARTVEQVRADINGKNEYTIVWGDTLGVISIATNIKQETLQSWNNIENADLIIAGNKLSFNGNVVTITDNLGNVIFENKVTDADKNNADAAVGFNKNTGSTNNNGPKGEYNEEEGYWVWVDEDGNELWLDEDGNEIWIDKDGNIVDPITPPTNNGNGGGQVTPPETEKPGNGNGGGEVTPPVTEQPGNGNGEGEVTPPETEEPGNGNGGGEVNPPETEEPHIVSGRIGNTGLEFGTHSEAWDKGEALSLENDMNGTGSSRFVVLSVTYSDGTVKYSLDFFAE